MGASSEIHLVTLLFPEVLDISSCFGPLSKYLEIVSNVKEMERGSNTAPVSARYAPGHATVSVQAHHFGRYNLVVEKLEASLIARVPTCTLAQ